MLSIDIGSTRRLSAIFSICIYYRQHSGGYYRQLLTINRVMYYTYLEDRGSVRILILTQANYQIERGRTRNLTLQQLRLLFNIYKRQVGLHTIQRKDKLVKRRTYTLLHCSIRYKTSQRISFVQLGAYIGTAYTVTVNSLNETNKQTNKRMYIELSALHLPDSTGQGDEINKSNGIFDS